MDLREPGAADVERVRELIESTLTASYALSPQQIDTLLEDEFDKERLEAAFEDADSVVLVAERPSVAGKPRSVESSKRASTKTRATFNGCSSIRSTGGKESALDCSIPRSRRCANGVQTAPPHVRSQSRG